MQRFRLIAMSSVLWLLAASASAKDVVVVTSFPKELFETYKKAFELKHPGVNVVINSKQTNAGVTYLRETKAKPEADIFWVSAPDAFQTLDTDGLLKNTPRRMRLSRKFRRRSETFRSTTPTANTLASPSAATA